MKGGGCRTQRWKGDGSHCRGDESRWRGDGSLNSGARGRPTQRRETDGEFGVTGGRETGNKKTRKGKSKINDVTTDATNKLIRHAKARTFTDPNPSRSEGDGNRRKGNKRGRRHDAEGKRNGTRKQKGKGKRREK